MQDEAAELLAGNSPPQSIEPEQALSYLSQHCEFAVVTLGDKGCIARRKGDEAAVQEPACSGVTVTDATGMFTDISPHLYSSAMMPHSEAQLTMNCKQGRFTTCEALLFRHPVPHVSVKDLDMVAT